MTEKERIVLVTGANRGIGFEVCRLLVDLGFRVILSARSIAKAEAAAQRIGGFPGSIIPLQLDVTNSEHVVGAVDFVESTFGRLDALVNNAAIDYDQDQRILTADISRMRDVFETNTLSVLSLTQQLIPLLRKSDEPRIVNVSSGAGSLASMTGGTPAYSLSKLALNGLTMMLSNALRNDHVLVNAICPGWVATDMGGPGGGPVAEGARSVVWGVTLPDDGPTGGFFRHGRRIEW